MAGLNVISVSNEEFFFSYRIPNYILSIYTKKKQFYSFIYLQKKKNENNKFYFLTKQSISK